MEPDLIKCSTQLGSSLLGIVPKRHACDKHSSLFWRTVVSKKRFSITLTTNVNVSKPLTKYVKKLEYLLPAKHFQPTLMLANKAVANPSGAL